LQTQKSKGSNVTEPVSSTAPTAQSLYQPLFSPRSIALIGASDDPAKGPARPLRYLRETGFRGTVYPINPKRDKVLGERAWPSLSALPEVPDHAFILTSTDAAMDALAECGERGVRVATILASGFSEIGPEGEARERRIREIVARTGIRVLGPSVIGIVNVHEGMKLTVSAAFAEPDFPQGGIFCASHSGSMMGALVSRGKACGARFAGMVSVGNEVDLSMGEICSATLDDPNVTGYLLFLETLRHAEALRDFAIGAAKRGKPVIAYKLGRSAAAAELAVSHTGALAGEDDVADAFLRDCGIARVETYEALLEGLPLLGRLPLTSMHGTRGRSPRVGVLTTTGGGAAMIVDQLGIRCITVERPSDETFARLKNAGVEVSQGRIVDLTMAGTRYTVMKSALDVMLSAPEFDLVIAVVGSSARFDPDVAVRPIIDSVSSNKPVAAFLLPHASEALGLLNAAGVPAFRTPESCADAIAAAFGRHAPPLDSARPTLPATAESGRMLDEIQAYALLDRIRVPHAPAVALDAAAAMDPAIPFPYPVAAKVLSAEIPHKSDVGGVALGIRNGTELQAAFARIRRVVAERMPDTKVDKILVQPMVPGIGEVLIGYRVDREVGPIIMLAAGGVLTEIYRDRSLRLAPVTRAAAVEMIGEVRALQALSGYRGREAGDLDALADAIVALSTLADMPDLAVLEAEINPLMVLRKGDGVMAVDALVKLA
jgi:acyl-CoA synthetase (NDP forming)